MNKIKNGWLVSNWQPLLWFTVLNVIAGKHCFNVHIDKYDMQELCKENNKLIYKVSFPVSQNNIKKQER